VANQISSGGADLLLNSSDMSLDGSAQENDLIEARRLHDTLALPLCFIPGNHDIGERDGPGSRGLPILSAATRRRSAPFRRGLLVLAGAGLAASCH
jgi:hypothetical protein